LLCFPIANTFEQFINAWHVRALGYGDFSTSLHPTAATFANFESRLDEYRQNVQARFVDGTDTVVNRVRELIEQYSRQKNRLP